jgi:hypothetical protein
VGIRQDVNVGRGCLYKHSGNKEYMGQSMNARAYIFLVWWFAVIAPSGETQYSEHRTERSCNIQQRNYAKLTMLKVTKCLWKPNSEAMEDVG